MLYQFLSWFKVIQLVQWTYSGWFRTDLDQWAVIRQRLISSHAELLCDSVDRQDILKKAWRVGTCGKNCSCLLQEETICVCSECFLKRVNRLLGLRQVVKLNGCHLCWYGWTSKAPELNRRLVKWAIIFIFMMPLPLLTYYRIPIHIHKIWSWNETTEKL